MGSFAYTIAAEGTVNLYPGMHQPPTTGFNCVNFLASLCDTLTIFGTSVTDFLDESAQAAGFEYHYYETQIPNERKPRSLLETFHDSDVSVKQQMSHDFMAERDYYLKRSSCTCRDEYAGVIFLIPSKLRPLSSSIKLIKHEESTKVTSPGGFDAVKQLFEKFKKN